MKKLKFSVILLLVYNGLVFSQPCLPEGIHFSTQEQVDGFQTNYPNCTEIEGDVVIIGYSLITNLNGLDVLNSIGGNLTIAGNTNLVNLEGLNALNIIEGSLFIGDASFANTNLSSLAGLNNLASVGGSVWISHNPSLVALTGLDNLTSIGGNLEIDLNANLISLSNLENLTSIGGNLWIGFHENLTSLEGLENINPGSITGLSIIYNYTLSSCDVLSICDYLISPVGFINIENNGVGCNSPEEVEEACETVNIFEFGRAMEISIFPNPATEIIRIKDYDQLKIESVNIYNQLGQKVFNKNKNIEELDISAIEQGIYIVELNYSSLLIRKKLLIK